jgi:cyclin K
MTDSQWLFPASALDKTPSVESGYLTRDRELYDRSRAVELLFRLGVTLQLLVATPSPAQSD